MLLKNNIFYMLHVVSFCFSKIRADLEFRIYKNNEEVTEWIKTIIHQCLKLNSGPRIFVGNQGKTDDMILNLLYTSNAHTFIFETNNDTIFKKNQLFREVTILNETSYVTKLNHPAGSFIITVSSYENITNLLKNLRNSIWWNSEALFLIINIDSKDSCKTASDILKSTWNFKVLSVIYLCKNVNKTFYLYTYNPYGNISSTLWTKTEAFHSSNQHWSLFQYGLQKLNYDSVCRDLYFDKMQNLNGYNVKAVILHFGEEERFRKNKLGCDLYRFMNNKIPCVAFSYLNANVTLKLSTTNHIDKFGKPHGMIKDIVSDHADYEATSAYIRGYWRQQSYPFFTSGLTVVSLKMQVNFTHQISRVLLQAALPFVLSFFLIYIMILKFIPNQSASSAIMEFFRIFVGHAILKKPKGLLNKILFIITIFAAFENSFITLSYLSAFRSALDTSAIDSYDDLINSNFKVYTSPFHADLFPSTFFKKMQERIHLTNRYRKCLSQLLKRDPVICIYAGIYLKFFICENKQIHMYDLFQRSLTYTFSEDSPFLTKFNYITLKLNEGGLIKLFLAMSKPKIVDEKSEKIAGNINELILNLYIWFLGWILAIFVLCLEIAVHKVIQVSKSRRVSSYNCHINLCRHQ